MVPAVQSMISRCVRRHRDNQERRNNLAEWLCKIWEPSIIVTAGVGWAQGERKPSKTTVEGLSAMARRWAESQHYLEWDWNARPAADSFNPALWNVDFQKWRQKQIGLASGVFSLFCPPTLLSWLALRQIIKMPGTQQMRLWLDIIRHATVILETNVEVLTIKSQLCRKGEYEYFCTCFEASTSDKGYYNVGTTFFFPFLGCVVTYTSVSEDAMTSTN